MKLSSILGGAGGDRIPKRKSIMLVLPRQQRETIPLQRSARLSTLCFSARFHVYSERHNWPLMGVGLFVVTFAGNVIANPASLGLRLKGRMMIQYLFRMIMILILAPICAVAALSESAQFKHAAV